MLRPQSSSSRQENEMASKSLRELQALGSSADPVQRLRLICLSRGATGILGLGRYDQNYLNINFTDTDYTKLYIKPLKMFLYFLSLNLAIYLTGCSAGWTKMEIKI